MSDPETAEEFRRADLTLAAAKPDEYLVSTACPACGIRFAMLTRHQLQAEENASLAGGQLKVAMCWSWGLRCVNCGHTCEGELK